MSTTVPLMITRFRIVPPPLHGLRIDYYGLNLVLCPKCKTDRAHRSHRQGVLERSAALFTYFPYRCRECDHRFLSRPAAHEQTSSEHRSTEREIRATRQAKDWARK